MKKEKIKKSTLLTGVIITGSLTAAASGNQNDLLNYGDMGSGAEVRSEINDINTPNVLNNNSTVYFAELKCGEGKCGGEDNKKNKKEKEGKNEDKKKEGKTSKKDKTSEAKCGEGKSGNKKSEKNDESKTSESKCGEGKCG